MSNPRKELSKKKPEPSNRQTMNSGATKGRKNEIPIERLQHQTAGKRSSKRASRGDTQQPLSAVHYVWISLIGIVIGILLLFSYILLTPVLNDYGISKNVYYIVLFIFGIVAGAFFFGAMRAYARFEQKTANYMLSLGGPVVIFFLVIFIGLKWIPDASSFNMTVFVHGPAGKQDIVLENKGKVMVDLGADRETKKIGENGAAYFLGIPPQYRGQNVEIGIQAEGFEKANPNAKYKLIDGAIYLEVKRDDSLSKIFGSFTDNEGRQLEGVRINVLDISAISDKNGYFKIDIPIEKQKKEQTLKASKDGYKNWSDKVYPGNDIGVEIVLQKE